MGSEFMTFAELSKFANMCKMLNVIQTTNFAPKIGIWTGVLKNIVLQNLILCGIIINGNIEWLANCQQHCMKIVHVRHLRHNKCKWSDLTENGCYISTFWINDLSDYRPFGPKPCRNIDLLV